MAEHPDYLYVTNPYNLNAKVHIAAKGTGRTLCGTHYKGAGWSKLEILTSEICAKCEKKITLDGFEVSNEGISKPETAQNKTRQRR